jgi:hypothetical protein
MNTDNNRRELILRNCKTDFYGDEILAEEHKFTPEYFASVREGGYTAIWIYGVLRDLVTFEQAPHWDKNNAARIAALNRITATAKKFGIGIYLYINEPKGFFPGEPMFEKYPDLQGAHQPRFADTPLSDIEPEYAFCTQSSFTEEYLTGGFARLFALCPDLAGVIAITATEIHSHCFSHGQQESCPRCKNSNAIDTVIDVLTKIRNGVRQSSATAKVVAWNWSWAMYEDPPQPKIISGLPQDVILQCDMQRGGSKTTDGIEMIVDEYSFSYLGPSPLFIGTAKVCEETGHELWAKLMVNTTHEFLSTPYLPLYFRLAKKTIAIRDYNARGWFACWNYGGHADTPMARLGSKIFTDDNFGENEIEGEVKSLAQELYGEDKAEAAFAAWKKFDAAFEYFPFDMTLIYYGPHMHGTGLEWIFAEEVTPMPWYWLKDTGRASNDLFSWCTYFTPEQVIELLTKLCDGWQPGVQILGDAFGLENPFDALPNFDELLGIPGFEDFNIARTMYFHYRSTIAFVKFRLASLAFFKNEARDAQQEIISTLLEEEKPRIRAMAQIVAAYPEIPYQEEAQQSLYTASDLQQKLRNIENFAFESGQRI